MSQATLKRELHAAIKQAGNKDSTFDAYWPVVMDFVNTTRRHRGNRITRDQITEDDVYYFRNVLANDRNQSPRTVNQAMSAIRFLFERVLHRTLEQRETDPLRLKQPTRQRRRNISANQITQVIQALSPHDQLIALMMFGCMSRLNDILNLRIKDLNFDFQQAEIADCKHDHFRIVPLPESLHQRIHQQIRNVEHFHRRDQQRGNPGVPVPKSFATKSPTAPLLIDWFWLFPSRSLSRDPSDPTAPKMRWHINDDAFRKRFTAAVRSSGVRRRITPHDMRRAGATHFYRRTKDIERLQTILGHNSIEQTFDYIFEDEIAISGQDSPIDAILAA